MKKIKKISGINNINEIEKEIIDIFKENNTEDFCTVLEKIKQKYAIEGLEILKNFKYKELVNDDIEKALSQEVISNALSDYMKKYNEILEQSEGSSANNVIKNFRIYRYCDIMSINLEVIF